MKRTLVATLTLVTLLVFAAAIAWAAPLDQGADLVFENISFAPPDPYPGQQVEVTISYTNTGSTVVPKDTEVGYQIVIEGSEDAAPESQFTLEGQFTLGEDVPSAESGEAKVPFYAPTKEGTYSVQVILTVDGSKTELGPQSLVVETALPSAVAQLFAGLGLFAAVMAIMAVGTEVVIESLKVVLGLKEKVTAMEAFDQLKRELPGQLSALGIDYKSLKQVDELVGKMQMTLQPVATLAAIPDHLRNGHFGAVVTALEGIKGLKSLQDENLDKLKENARRGIQNGFAELQGRLPVSPALAGELDKLNGRLVQEVDNVTPEKAAELLEKVFLEVQKVLSKDGPQLTAEWLRSQVDTLLTQGREKVTELLEKDIIGTLRELGFAETNLKALKAKVEGALDSAEEATQETTNTYTRALQNLLEAVEKRRNEMQGPARKIWRRLRKSHMGLGTFDVVVVGLLFVGLVWVIFAWWPVGWAVDQLKETVSPPVVALVRWGGPFVWGLAIGFVLWGVSALAQWLVPKWLKRYVQGQDQGAGEPPLPEGTIGYFLRYVVERSFNCVLGRGATLADAERYGKVDAETEEKVKGIGPTTVAKVLLEREDQHQDEETSRIRIMRVISIVVGTLLAYHLQIDAAKYLNYAVPGIEGRINAVSLHALWSVIPENLTVGIVLTGLAASAGSKFWRDLLGRLQTARGQAEEAARLVRRVRGMLPGEEEES